MIAHQQTFVGNGDNGATPGNCMQAALASLLDLPLDQVPHFALFEKDWRKAIEIWLRGRGKQLRVYNDWAEHVAVWEAANVPAFPLGIWRPL